MKLVWGLLGGIVLLILVLPAAYNAGYHAGGDAVTVTAKQQQELAIKQTIATRTHDWARIKFAIRSYDEFRACTLTEARLDKKYMRELQQPGHDYPADYELAVYRRDMAEHNDYRAYVRLKPFDREIYCWVNNFNSWTFEVYDGPRIVKIQQFNFPEKGSRSEFYEKCESMPVNGDIWDLFNLTTTPGAAERAYNAYKSELQKRNLWVDEPKD